VNTEVNMYEAIKWPEDMAPSRSPIHFTNRLAARIFQAMASPTGDHARRYTWRQR
jgi:hypothetical protein